MSFPRYPKYEDSSVEWLGEVPAHWEVRRLKSIVEEPLKYGANESAELDDRMLPRFVRITDIDDTGGLCDDTFKSLPMAIAEPFLLKDGDVLLARSGATVGKSFIYSQHWGTACFAGYLIRARLRHSSCLARWLYYFCQTDEYWGYVVGNQIQATIQNVSAEKYANLYLPLPRIADQSSIVAFLDRETAKIDELVAEQRRLMELLKEKRQAIISHAVTKGLNPNAPMKPSGIEWLGDVAAHWDVIALKRIADVQTGVAKGKEYGSVPMIEVPYLRVANVQDGYLDLETVATIEIPSEDLERYALRPGDVLMNEGGDFDKLGRGHIWDGQIDPCITQNHVFAVRPRKVTSVWLNAITGSDYAQFYFMTRSKQSTNLASISSTNLMELPVLLPPNDEQNAILSFISNQTSQFDALTAEAQHAIDLLQERRTALISAAVTGQIDIRAAVTV